MSSSFFSSTTGDHLSFTGFLDDILLDFPPQNVNSSVIVFSGSDDNNNNNSTPKTNTSSSGSNDGEKNLNPVDEQLRRRRKISNRESARRSRLRKQKHLETLRNRLSGYETGNRELMKRLMFVNHHGQIFRRENQRLRSESVMLQQKLCYLHQALLELHHHPLSASAWPCNY
ncbi:basic leucine zipper 4-like [Cynara cardunculus var. scolymus]|uniref:Basic-leucine zipper domain-containing protein n=1 Tax=Cynara cardunculus var. scolymus TaxID=59895 RepID=A0A118JUR2_CYNCS|nr:basic leucine zipper 4-like [Cynara cardunculus var. scolymus]KVH92469.1 Basic-leucine zipper domain-containing protein [Cynara cardunculus var. scolymus]